MRNVKKHVKILLIECEGNKVKIKLTARFKI